METPRLDPTTREAIIQELAAGAADVLTIGQRQGLSPEETAAWAAAPANSDWITQLTQAADRHTQWVISRYRLAVASAMLAVVNREDAKPADVVRAATLMLKLQLNDPPTDADRETPSFGEDDLREILAQCYGQADEEGHDELD